MSQYLRNGFTRAGFRVTDDGIQHILEMAQEVPYSVQQLAHVAWELLQANGGSLTPAFVHPLWNSLTRQEKTARKAVLRENGVNLRAALVLSRVSVAKVIIARTRFRD